MPRSENQKMKILRVMQILTEFSDSERPIPMSEIIEKLAGSGIYSERKSVYADIEALREFGLDIARKKNGYYVKNRDFELAELKLLVDAVQSFKFITAARSAELIGKLARLASHHEAAALSRQVYVSGRAKTMNESVLINIDQLHSAIAEGRKITFFYFDLALDFSQNNRLKRLYRRNEQFYTISPWSLLCSDDCYYLIAFDSEAEMIKHYRVDKMDRISLTQEMRDGREQFVRFDPAIYSKTLFGMFGGQTQTVRLRAENRFAGVFNDQFGDDAFYSPHNDTHFSVSVEVVVSPQFFSWIFGLGGGVEIVSPTSVKESFQKMLRNFLE